MIPNVDQLTQKTIDLINKGTQFRRRFIEESGWNPEDFLIVLSGDESNDRTILKKANLCFEYYQAKRVIVLSVNRAEFDNDNVEYYQCAVDEYESFAALFRLYRFSTRVVFADTAMISQYTFEELEGVCGITVDELAERAILGIMLPGNPRVFDEKLDIFSETELNRLMDLFHCGRRAYNEIRQKYKEEKILYNNRATGNTYILCGLLPEYINKIKSPYIVLNSRKECQSICELYDINCEYIGAETGEALKLFCDTIGGNSLCFQTMDPYNRHNNLIRMRGFKGLDFLTIYSRIIYQTDNPEKLLKTIRRKLSDAFFEDLGVAPGRTVLLSPISNTMGVLLESEWIQLIDDLRNQGFDVVLNLPQDYPGYVNEKKFLCPYDSIIDFAEKCGFFIGVRSGLCDIVSEADCHMIVIYPKTGRTIRDEAMFNYFSLNRMKLRHEKLDEIQVGMDDKLDCAVTEAISKMS